MMGDGSGSAPALQEQMRLPAKVVDSAADEVSAAPVAAKTKLKPAPQDASGNNIFTSVFGSTSSAEAPASTSRSDSGNPAKQNESAGDTAENGNPAPKKAKRGRKPNKDLPSALPVARIRNIMRDESEHGILTPESVVLMSKATKMFMQWLVQGHTGKTFSYDALVQRIKAHEPVDFLLEYVPECVPYGQVKAELAKVRGETQDTSMDGDEEEDDDDDDDDEEEEEEEEDAGDDDDDDDEEGESGSGSEEGSNDDGGDEDDDDGDEDDDDEGEQQEEGGSDETDDE
ncbi:hypothetical protein PTSG_04234 [Salpingoeca rosetta]|uniref:Transcription factor CBF/NF-Y/archaeal histone domain-containing protein n=1 Tax=Salpingoeca rosetta (strain ATCC 50818 / BSB-021) TaxID=946362 RepID=F2U6Z4_SALR5|nr:uncharacterized protein PTSG_04234 [Salpingoeca rosetta]EGD83626.1 hypothetical protein PTSG_04234 [Salpingoeca rosetta]|eukprot:XP_004995130.1 hypothetical protein PTSG_04234 [Salpingoeca rosetta]